MKLHLPTLLRAAVIAAMALVCIPQTFADVVYKPYKIVVNGTGTMTDGAGSVPITLDQPVSFSTGDWAMSVTGSGFSSTLDSQIPFSFYTDGGPSMGFLANKNSASNIVYCNMGQGFAIMQRGKDIIIGCSALNSDGAFTNYSAYGDGKFGKINEDGTWTLNFVYKYETGTLTVTRPDEGSGEEITREFTGITMRNDNDITLTGVMDADGKVPGGATTEVVVTIDGTEDAWNIDGPASFTTMQNGGYTDAEGNPINYTNGQIFYFIGQGGVLQFESDASLSSEFMSAMPVGEKGSPTIGLEVQNGSTVTIGESAQKGQTLVNSNLSLSGDGTLVVVSSDNLDLSAHTIAMADGFHLTLDVASGKTGTIQLGAETGKDVTIDSTANLTAQLRSGSTINGTTLQAAGNLALGGAGTIIAKELSGTKVTISGGDITAETIKATNMLSITGGNLHASHTALTVGEIEQMGGTTEFGTIDGLDMFYISGGTATVNELVNTTVERSGGTLTVKEMSGADFAANSYFGFNIIEDASSTDTLTVQTLGVNHGYIVDGTLAADAVKLMSNYTLVADDLEVTTLESATSADIISYNLLGGTVVVKNSIQADSVNMDGKFSLSAAELTVGELAAGGLGGSNLLITDAVLTKGAGSASSISKATTPFSLTPDVTLAEGYVLSGTGADAALTGVKVQAANNSTIKNFTIADSTKVQGAAETDAIKLDNVTLAGGNASFDAFSVDTDVNSVKLTGTTTDTSVDINHIAIDATNQTFSEHVIKTITVLKATGAEAVNYADGTVTLLMPAYVTVSGNDAQVDADGNLVLKAYGDTTHIKEELADNENRRNSLQQLDEAAASGGEQALDIQRYIGTIYGADLDTRKAVLSAVSGASLANLTDAQRRGIEDVQKNLRNRIVQMGGQEDGILHGWDKGNVQAWAQGDGAFHTLGDSEGASGYDFDVYGATVGANVDLNEHWTVGGALSAEFGTITSKSSDNMEADTESIYVNLFARYQKGHWTQMGIFTIGQDSIDTTRKVLGYTADGSTSGSSFSGYYELGYLIPLDEETRQLIQPIFNVSLTSAKVDGFSESGSIGTAGLKYDGESLFYGSVGIGARYQAVLSQSVYERNTVLELRGQLNQHFGDSTDEATVSFLGGGSPYTVHGAESGDFGVQLGAGLTIPVYNQTTLFGDVDGEFRSKQTDFRANIGVRYEF